MVGCEELPRLIGEKICGKIVGQTEFAQDFEKECALFQYALSTRAGTDCVVAHVACNRRCRPISHHSLRGWYWGVRPRLEICSVGAIGEDAQGAAILPFVWLSCATPSNYSWWDAKLKGDPLMPLLFSIGIQAALEEVAAILEPGERL